LRKIITNKVKCRLCGDVIESTYRNDIKSCKCGEITVDGGTDYIRRGWQTDRANIIELSEYEEEHKIPEEEIRLFQDHLRKKWLEEIKEIGGLEAYLKGLVMTLPEIQKLKKDYKNRQQGVINNDLLYE